MDRPTRNVFGALQYTAPRFKLDNTLPLVLETIRITCRFNPRGGGGGGEYMDIFRNYTFLQSFSCSTIMRGWIDKCLAVSSNSQAGFFF